VASLEFHKVFGASMATRGKNSLWTTSIQQSFTEHQPIHFYEIENNWQ